MNVHSETALVTGACSGIGLAIAHRLAARGFALVLVSNREEPLARAAAEIAAAHSAQVHTIVQDLAAPEAAEALVAAVDARGLQIDVLVNNAGVFFFGEAVDADPARARAMLQLHVTTPSLLCTLLGARMRARRRGRILLVSSISAWRPFPGIGYYASSKAYLRSFAAALRSELAVYGVSVTCLAPGATATALYDPNVVPVARARRLGVMMDAEVVAEAGVQALLRGDALCVPGLVTRAMTTAAVLTPQPLIDWLRRRAPWLRSPKQ
ncbi:SDR family NAD(P)-dependent oxidoreductase [Nannocystis punicea]|uniref:SDR family NAD(P)-dependent oxidoreductase n=1 Tax=Nannocystis punicea TaxID=2995304 RepID=A0ABY7H2Q8_9BACT|nr:SDR family NAD(P)-dependent oxidoreductase [Nannocystis poenicansa]WAS93553.1 SDR family NAD(P)-dependent oxidoreductase [Nannocystis poenicansa]